MTVSPCHIRVMQNLEWQAIVSGNAELKLAPAAAGCGQALRMDFDFKGGGGFVVARHALQRPMPEEYAVRFRLRGNGATNNLELKLVDATGQNVWRHVRKDLRLPARWRTITIDSSAIDFAWGPSSNGHIKALGSIEIAIVAGQGGSGTLWIAGLEIEDRSPSEAPRAAASSALPEFDASSASPGWSWRPRPNDPHPWIAIDSVEPRVIGGMVVEWLEQAPASGFRVRVSNTGRRWKTVHAAARAGGKRSYLYLPALKARYLRVELNEPSAGATLRLQSFEFSRSIHTFWNNVAGGEARGWHPRWLHNEQTLWTPFGTSHGIHCALMNDDGMVEVDQGSFSIEPMLWVKGRLVSWTDVAPRQELLDGWMPVPSVIWETEEWRLRMRSEATPSGSSRVCYRFENLTAEPLIARLFVLLRPFQVTPPWQSFREFGGVSPIHDLAWRDGVVYVNETARLVPESGAGAGTFMGFGALSFDAGFMAAVLGSGTLPDEAQTHDSFGFATGALGFALSPQALESVESIVHCMTDAALSKRQPLMNRDAAFVREPAFDWRPTIATGQWSGNGWVTDAVQAALTATTHILVTRRGPALQPGPRRYTRSWIRDSAMMSAALLRMGHTDEVRDFIRWYAPYQRADGFVPCCVDREGVDWLVEHDSHGELLALIADYYRFTSNDAFLRESWIHIDKAVGCIEGLLGADGLLPTSVSHEGYLAQPVHSYWDDFWALRGIGDAAYLARAAGHENSARRWDALSARLAAALYSSIEATRAKRGLDFIPGSIEWADFDPTATANAIYLLDVPEGLNRRALEQTFDKYLADWHSKRSGAVPSTNYTPYEIRIIGALVRLGRREAALELLRFFLADRRPQAWNQWPEIAWQDRQSPAHVGDLPHTWIAAEYLLAVRSLFAYEREADRCLVLAAGLAAEWIEGGGVQVTNMPTLYGALSYSLQRMDGGALRFEISGASAAKIILRPPLAAALRSVRVDGAEYASFDDDSVTLPNAAREVICTTAQGSARL
ncbi:MAG: discoidin domain-containing protein [Gammaproteobacteria bacterium]